MKTLIIALFLASCVSSKPVMKTDTVTERECLAHYRNGDMTYAQYKECLKSEKGP